MVSERTLAHRLAGKVVLIMKYAFAYKALGSSPSEDNFDRHIHRGVGADEAVEKGGYSGMALGMALLGGLLAGLAVGYYYRDTELRGAVFTVPPPRPTFHRRTSYQSSIGPSNTEPSAYGVTEFMQEDGTYRFKPPSDFS